MFLVLFQCVSILGQQMGWVRDKEKRRGAPARVWQRPCLEDSLAEDTEEAADGQLWGGASSTWEGGTFISGRDELK